MNNIDVLRALAVLSVFFHHVSHVYQFNVPFLATYGGVFGVQLFFLLSGYLIVQSAEKYSLKTYFTHRVFRIFPAYLLMFFIIGIGTSVIYWSKVLDNPLALLSNVLLIQHLVPKHLLIFDSLNVSWTLTIELIWYLLAPALLILFRNHLNKTVLVSFAISVTWVYFSGQGSLDWLFEAQFYELGIAFSTHRTLFLNNAFIALMCYFIIGAYIYYREQELKTINPVLLLLVFIVCSGVYFINPESGFSPNFVTGLGLGSLLVFSLRSKVLYSKLIKFIADISYSFYLIHLPVLVLLRDAFHLSSKWYFLLALILTLAISFLIYRVVERPMMDWARRLTSIDKHT